VADDLDVSLIQQQVEMGVAARMAVLATLAAQLDAPARSNRSA
jgi:aspartate carbamoyltransferase catalytic subunit